MNKNSKKIEIQKRLGRTALSSKFVLVPVYKQPLDINKIGNALVLLATKLAEEKTAKPIDHPEITEPADDKSSDTGEKL